MTTVLGISNPQHNSGAALVSEGEILSAIDEAKLSRLKRDGRFPSAAINYLLEEFSGEEITHVAFAGTDYPFSKRKLIQSVTSSSRISKKIDTVAQLLYSVFFDTKDTKTEYEFNQAINQEAIAPIRNISTTYVDHHRAHAAGAYYTSGFSQATILTADGAGDGFSSTIYKAKNGELNRIASNSWHDSIGRLWSRIPTVFGFKGGRHAGKFMGLAAYAEPPSEELSNKIDSLIEADGLSITSEFFRQYDHLSNEEQIMMLKEKLGKYDAPKVALSLQKRTEDVLTEFAAAAVDKTRISDVATAGGVFANVKANQRIYELPNVNRLFVHPDMRDSGLALGAALQVYASIETYKPELLSNVFFGPEFGDKSIERCINRNNLRERFQVSQYENKSSLAEDAADLLADGDVVNLYTGRVEYGPRALGNRSTLYQPTDPSAIKWLNSMLDRTEFMPFAPVTLKDHADECYERYEVDKCPAAEFMTISLDCTDRMADRSPGVVHVDGTARPQIIDKGTHPFYYEILESYHERTGIPSLINTSFNMHGEPIVCTPSQAVKSFKQSGTDAVILNDWLVKQ
jgi:carbamoyltransferase